MLPCACRCPCPCLEHVRFNPGHFLLLRSRSHTLAVRRARRCRNGVPQGADGAFGRCPQKRLELRAGGVFNRVEVGAVGREIEQRAAGGFYGLSDAICLVGRQVVHDDHVAGREGRHENLLDIGLESHSVHRPVKDHRRGHAGEPERPGERRSFPMTMRNARSATLSARRDREAGTSSWKDLSRLWRRGGLGRDQAVHRTSPDAASGGLAAPAPMHVRSFLNVIRFSVMSFDASIMPTMKA